MSKRFGLLCSIWLLSGALCWMPAQVQPVSKPADRITDRIDESELVTLKGNVHPLVRSGFDRGAASASTATGRMILVLKRSSEQDRALKQYLEDVLNPASPSFHQWLSPTQYAARFGISDNDLSTVTGWLQAKGFKVEKVPQARNIVEFSGTFGQVQNALHTSIHTFSVKGVQHYANVGDPQIPRALAPVIAGVGPLNSFHPRPGFVAGPRGHWDATSHSIQPDLTLKDTNGNFYLFVDPADAATIYDTPNTALNPNYSGSTWSGLGVSIGIVGVSDLTTADVQNYREAFLGEVSGAVNMPVQVVDGNDPGLIPGGAADEALLDNEVAGGMAPGANIYYYTAADSDLSSGLFKAIFRAIDDNTVSILSASFGDCESDLGTSGNQLILEAAEQAAAQGISFVVSSGDAGSAGCDNFDTQSQAKLGLAVNGLASTPYTVAVGGTDFDTIQNSFSSYANTANSGTAPYYRTALKYIPENPWNDSTKINTTIANDIPYVNNNGNGNIIAGSGGVSSVYGKPAWQTSLTPNDNARDLPDVSFLAANGFYHAMWVFCGDSASDGSSSGYVACQTSGGQFTSSTVFQGIGGTSASAPAFAGMLALVSQSQGGTRLGQPDPVLYGLAGSKYATVFHDVTTGNNSVPCAAGSGGCGANGFLTGYNAGTGYDLATGLGSIDIAKLVQNWTNFALAATSTTLNLNGSTSAYSGVHGASVTFNAGVTSSGATPTGNIAVIDTANETSGGTTAGPQNNGQLVMPLTSGTGSAAYNGLPGGSYTVEARYGGDASHGASTSSPISVTISPEASTTLLEVNAYDPTTGTPLGLTNIPYGSAIIADAQIEGKSEGSNTRGVATGSVAFSNGSLTLGTATVGSDNNASLPLFGNKAIPLSAGTQTVTASYSGDASYNSSTSSGVVVSLTKAATTTAITGYQGTVTAPQPFYVNISTTFLAPVQFSQVDSSPSYTVAVNGKTLGPYGEGGDIGYTGPGGTGNYVFLTEIMVDPQYLQQGQNVVSVTYIGGTNYTPSSSANVTINDTVGLGSFTLTNSGDISAMTGSGGNSQLTVTPAGGFQGQINFACSVSGAPAGVSCLVPTTYITGAAAASTSLVVDTTSAAPPGSYPIVVTASDYATGKITATTTVNLTVTTAPPALSLSTTGSLYIVPGATTGNTVGISVAPVNGFTGPVNLSCSLTNWPTNAVDLPTCSITSPVTITGPAAATATLTVLTTAPSTASLKFPRGGSFLAKGGSIFALLVFLGIPARRRGWRGLLAMGIVAILASAVIACGGGGGSGGGSGGGTSHTNPGTTPGTYTFTIKAADAATGQIAVSGVVTANVN